MTSACEWLYRKTGPHYIVLVMLGTRVFGSVGGLLVIYYVELALTLPPVIRTNFRIASAIVVVIGCTLTVLLALWETRVLRRVLRERTEGRPSDREELQRAVYEAVTFTGRHHRHEAWLVPCSTLVPVLIFLWGVHGAAFSILFNITLTVFMGISIALMSTFFAVDACMQPLIRDLLKQAGDVRFEELPRSRIQFRFGLCSTLIIMTTALMISTLARERTNDIVIAGATGQQAALENLRRHSLYITLAAVATGVVFSRLLSSSVVNRVDSLVKAMERVAGGRLNERLLPTGNDEIDVLSRQFNAMVAQLQHNHHVIQDLNTNLELKVRQRTQQLEEALQQLRDTQTQLTDVARQAGMAEVATGVLHNVGNVLNSVNVSTTCLKHQVVNSRLFDLQRVSKQLAIHRNGLAEYLRDANKGEKLVDYLTALGDKLAEERHELDGELNDLIDKIGHVKGIVATQQNYARRVHFSEQLEIAAIIEDVLGLHRQRLTNEDIEVVRDYRDRIMAQLEKANLVQVLDNLVKNAIDAMVGRQCRRRVLTIRLAVVEQNRAEILVADTGCGIAQEHLKSIFSYGFSTKPTGNGFGLHSSALAMSAIGGAIMVESDGLGQGSRFLVRFPLQLKGKDRDSASQSDGTGPPVPADHSTAGGTAGDRQMARQWKSRASGPGEADPPADIAVSTLSSNT